MYKRRVVITGLGVVSPLGIGVPENWRNILAGKSGIKLVTRFDVSAYSTKFGGVIDNFNPELYIPKKDIKKMDDFIQYGVAAAHEAIQDAGIQVTDENRERIGVAIGSGIGGLKGIIKGYQSLVEGGPRKVSPFFIPSNIINMVAGQVSIIHGLQGPNIAIVTACTSGTHNIGFSARLIACDDADVMIAGGSEYGVSECTLAGFSAAKALSSRNDDPTAASRPWDRDRDGFVLSDGAGVVVLEEYEMAKARGATIYAEVTGFGMSADAYHMTQPEAGGEGAARCMAAAMKNAGINTSQVDYINAHGTSTFAGDLAETHGVKRAFGDDAKKVAISSTKSMTGHTLGAAGGIEAVYTALAIRDQVAPPTINLDNPDPACDLDYVPNTARNMKIDFAMSNSFGFGGTNGTLLLKRLT